MKIKKILNFIYKNLDNLIALAISIVIAITGVITNKLTESALLASIAGVLALLAYGTIRDTTAREELQAQINQIKKTPTPSMILRDRTEYTPFKNLIEPSHQIYLMGASLVNIFSQWSDYLVSTKITEHETSIRVIILDPNSQSLKYVANCMGVTENHLSKEIDTTIFHYRTIIEKLPKEKRKFIELRIAETYPNHNMVILDSNTPNGKIFVEFIGYHTQLQNRPHILLTPISDQRWYEMFLQQFDELWKTSKKLPN